jgi:hypothetical protein
MMMIRYQVENKILQETVHGVHEILLRIQIGPYSLERVEITLKVFIN